MKVHVLTITLINKNESEDNLNIYNGRKYHCNLSHENI